MRGYLTLGATPAEETCAQLGTPEYDILAIAECKRFVALLRKKFGPEPTGAKLSVKGFSHDYGIYHEVVCWYDDRFPKSEEYALKCESEAPLTWEE